MSGGTCPGLMSGGAGLGKRCRVGTDMSQKLRCVHYECLNIEKTRKKAGENTMMGRLEGDEGIE